MRTGASRSIGFAGISKSYWIPFLINRINGHFGVGAIKKQVIRVMLRLRYEDFRDPICKYQYHDTITNTDGLSLLTYQDMTISH